MTSGQSDSQMTPLEWIAAIVCAPLGLLLGLLYLINGSPKAGKMLVASMLCSLLLCFGIIALIGVGLIRL